MSEGKLAINSLENIENEKILVSMFNAIEFKNRFGLYYKDV